MLSLDCRCRPVKGERANKAWMKCMWIEIVWVATVGVDQVRTNGNGKNNYRWQKDNVRGVARWIWSHGIASVGLASTQLRGGGLGLSGSLSSHSPSHPPTQQARQIDTQMRFHGANAMHCIACTVRCFDSICRCVVLVVALLLPLFWASPCCWHCGLLSSHFNSVSALVYVRAVCLRAWCVLVLLVNPVLRPGMSPCCVHSPWLTWLDLNWELRAEHWALSSRAKMAKCEIGNWK